jgi:hypothetical protein
MTGCETMLVSEEKRVWMRLRSHTVVFEREPDFERWSRDASGAILRIFHLWVAEPAAGAPSIRHYLGSVRFCGGWMSRAELSRLFREATVVGRRVGLNVRQFRGRVSRYLRESVGGPSRTGG